jgi:5-methylcytosine-specific restriction endonuclease McrA
MNHGTTGGYAKHWRLKEPPCDACSAAQTKSKKQYREKNIVRMREREKNYKKLNYDKVRQYLVNWGKNNPDKLQGYSRKKRAIRKNVIRIPYTIQDVTDQYGTNCHICKEPIDFFAPRKVGKNGWEMSLHLDHVIPLSKGGGDNISNVKPSHARCNLIKGNKS